MHPKASKLIQVQNRTCGNSVSLQLHSFLLVLSEFQCIFQAVYPAIFQKRHLGANRIQPQSSSALPSFLLKLPLRFFFHSVAIGWVAALYISSKAHMIRHQQVCVCERDKARVKASERGGGTSRLMFNTKWDCLHLLPEEPWEIRPSLPLCSFLLASVMFHFCSLQRGAFWQPRRFRFCAIGHFHNCICLKRAPVHCVSRCVVHYTLPT